MCCRADSPAKPDSIPAGYWGSKGYCDLPESTFFFAIEEIVKRNPEVIIYTGDNAPHDVWSEECDSMATEVLQMFLKKLDKLDFKGEVVIALGNHEIFPVNQFDFNSKAVYKPFYKKYADILEKTLDSKAIHDFKEGGYFSILKKGIRFIAYNCIPCNSGNGYSMKNPTDPHGMFKWMENELRLAEAKGEPVYITGHIPFAHMGITTECTLRYKALVDRFSNTIRGQFFGHTHYDEFKVNSDYLNSTEDTGVMYIAPSLTTYHDRLPIFKEFDIFAKSKAVHNSRAYRINIENLTEKEIPEVEQLYDFLKVRN